MKGRGGKRTAAIFASRQRARVLTPRARGPRARWQVQHPRLRGGLSTLSSETPFIISLAHAFHYIPRALAFAGPNNEAANVDPSRLRVPSRWRLRRRARHGR